MIMFSIYFRCD